jgi:hypothetical protein
MPRALFLAMPFYDSLHRYFPAWIKHFGYEGRWVPVTNRPRAAGSSKYSNIGRAAAGFFDLLGVKWLMKRTHIPSKELLFPPLIRPQNQAPTTVEPVGERSDQRPGRASGGPSSNSEAIGQKKKPSAPPEGSQPSPSEAVGHKDSAVRQKQ